MGVDQNRDVILAYEILPSIPKEHHNFQEVKDCAITCVGLVISTFGDQAYCREGICCNSRFSAALRDMLCPRASSLRIKCIVKEGNQPLRQATHGTLNTLIVGYGDKIGLAAYKVIIVEISSLIRSSPSVGPTVRIMILPRAMTLVKSSLLQGQALQALQEFFAVLVRSANTIFDELLETLVSTAKTSPEAGGAAAKDLFSVATCIAVLCLAAGHEKCWSTVDMLANILKDDSNVNVILFLRSTCVYVSK
ncbi:Cullin-associated NEDD8-dissociated protein 1 [Orobanche minor]